MQYSGPQNRSGSCFTKRNITLALPGHCKNSCEVHQAGHDGQSRSSYNNQHLVARTTPLRKIEKMIDFYIFCISTGLEKFIGANCDQTGPLIETLSNFKMGVRQENCLSI